MAMPQNLNHELKLIRDLVSVDTDSNMKSNYVKMCNVLKHMLQGAGAKTAIISPKAKDGKPRPNVVGYVDNGASHTLAINCHYDIVPITRSDWKTDPFSIVIKGDKVYGRGTNDDKGAIALALGAMKDAKRCNVNLEFYFTCDEETGSVHGMQYLAEHRRNLIKAESALVLDGEPLLGIGCSGGIGGKITIKGKEAHGGMPFMGSNPIDKALVFLNRLNGFKSTYEKKTSKYYGNPTRKVYNRFTITMIHSGVKENLIPGSLEARFDLRVIPESNIAAGVSAFRAYFDKVKKETGIDAAFDVVFEHAGSITRENSPIVKRMQKITGQKRLYASFGGTDATFFRNIGIPSVDYGIFNGSAHGANEFALLSDMARVKRDVVSLLESY